MIQVCQTFRSQQPYCLSDAVEQVITRPEDSCSRPVSNLASRNTAQN